MLESIYGKYVNAKIKSTMIGSGPLCNLWKKCLEVVWGPVRGLRVSHPYQRPSQSEYEARRGWPLWSCGAVVEGKRAIKTGDKAGIDMGASGVLEERESRRPFEL